VGEYFSIDTGRYSIEQDCHSVVLVDGLSGRSTDGEWTQSHHHGTLTGFEPGRFCDFASVDSSYQHSCYWARRYLGLVKGTRARSYVWTVEDINNHNTWAEYWWQMQTSPENRIRLYRRQAVIRGWRHGNLLNVHFVLPAPGEYPEPHRLELARDVAVASSWRYLRSDPSRRDGRYSGPADHVKRFERPADMVHGPVYARPRLLAKVAGFNGRFMSLMIPCKKGEPAPRVRRLRSLPDSLAVRIVFPEVEDTLIFAYEHNLLEAGDVRGRGKWCVVRRDSESGDLLRYAIGDGTALDVAGKKLRV